MENINTIIVRGTVEKEPELNTEIPKGRFYNLEIKVKRDSGTYDYLPVIIPEEKIKGKELVGKEVYINGQIRTFNQWDEREQKRHLKVFLFAKEIEEDEYQGEDVNEVHMQGFICKPPIYRKTPKEREIADIMLAVNRPHRKTDYIPCICWGRNARYVSVHSFVGQEIQISGRLQSREYIKRDGENAEKKMAYEVSISSIEPIETGGREESCTNQEM